MHILCVYMYMHIYGYKSHKRKKLNETDNTDYNVYDQTQTHINRPNAINKTE